MRVPEPTTVFMVPAAKPAPAMANADKASTTSAYTAGRTAHNFEVEGPHPPRVASGACCTSRQWDYDPGNETHQATDAALVQSGGTVTMKRRARRPIAVPG